MSGKHQQQFSVQRYPKGISLTHRKRLPLLKHHFLRRDVWSRGAPMLVCRSRLGATSGHLIKTSKLLLIREALLDGMRGSAHLVEQWSWVSVIINLVTAEAVTEKIQEKNFYRRSPNAFWNPLTLHWIKGVQTMSIASRPVMEGAPTPVKPSKNTKAVHVYCHPKLLFRTFKLFPLLCVGCNFLSGPSKGAQFKPEPSKHMIHCMS